MGQDFRLHGHIIPLFWFKELWRTILFFSRFSLGFFSFYVCVFFSSLSFFCFIHVHIFNTGRHQIRVISHMFPLSLVYILELDRMAEGKLTEVSLIW